MRTKSMLFRYLCCLLFFLLIVICPAATGKIIYVDDDSTGANDGSSWQNAYTFLQDALVDAETSEKPLDIRVAQGIYTPNRNSVLPGHTGNREDTFQLINNVTIMGGYAGFGERNPDARDIEIYQTILSGDLNGDDREEADPYDWLRGEPNQTDNSYHVVTGSNTDETAVLDGFNIMAGTADQYRRDELWGEVSSSTDDEFWNGGGMYNVSGSPTLTNCTFSRNRASSCGGGIYNIDGNPMLVNCKFIRNLAGTCGGGMYNTAGNPVLVDSPFYANSTNWQGGGLFNSDDSSPILTNCIFNENSARDGYSAAGGAISNWESSPNLTNCTFTDNWAYAYGGGVYNRDSNPALINCVFARNSAERHGGAIYNWQSSLTSIYCTYNTNSAAYGGAIYNWESSLISDNCTHTGNSALYGGVMHIWQSTLSMVNCTFAQNSAQHGSTINYESSKRWPRPNSIMLVNCILWNGGDEIWNNEASTIDIVYSDVRGGWPGVGNINTDPLFASTGYWANVTDPNIIVDSDDPNALWVNGDYHLKSQAGRWDPVSESWVQDAVTSPCIDAGYPNTPVGDEPIPNGGGINMGAYGGTAEASKS